VNFLHSRSTTLLDDLRGKIDFIMRGTDAWTQLHDEIRRADAETVLQKLYRVCRNAERAAFFARMHKTDSAAISIDEVDRTTIGDVYSETDISLIRDHPVTIFETVIARKRRIDDRDLVTVNLPGCGESVAVETEFAPGATVFFVEMREHSRFVSR
jgi:hypothetical protein